jgi:hypothetical protein
MERLALLLGLSKRSDRNIDLLSVPTFRLTSAPTFSREISAGNLDTTIRRGQLQSESGEVLNFQTGDSLEVKDFKSGRIERLLLLKSDKSPVLYVKGQFSAASAGNGTDTLSSTRFSRIESLPLFAVLGGLVTLIVCCWNFLQVIREARRIFAGRRGKIGAATFVAALLSFSAVTEAEPSAEVVGKSLALIHGDEDGTAVLLSLSWNKAAYVTVDHVVGNSETVEIFPAGYRDPGHEVIATPSLVSNSQFTFLLLGDVQRRLLPPEVSSLIPAVRSEAELIGQNAVLFGYPYGLDNPQSKPQSVVGRLEKIGDEVQFVVPADRAPRAGMSGGPIFVGNDLVGINLGGDALPGKDWRATLVPASAIITEAEARDYPLGALLQAPPWYLRPRKHRRAGVGAGESP